MFANGEPYTVGGGGEGGAAPSFLKISSTDANESLMKWCVKEFLPPLERKLASGHLFIWLYTYIFIVFS